MPSEEHLPIDLDQLPLAARTRIRDVRLVSIEAQAPDVPTEGTAIHFAMGEVAYRVEADTLFGRIETTTRYFEGETDAGDPESDAAESVGREVGRLTLVVLAELAFEGGAVSQVQADEFMERNLIVMLFPYIRNSVQRLSAELRLPQTVLPNLPGETWGVTEDVGAPG